ncbi:unnamed protein product [Pieris brassicae]|uniref:C2H2-type domain-containing protein n=1 Tax=Pieris brassicae TaxID=7116 RepID=A0A9P0XIF5_PIEBR|nr:unnamed protein product [Pieris brassicae]
MNLSPQVLKMQPFQSTTRPEGPRESSPERAKSPDTPTAPVLNFSIARLMEPDRKKSASPEPVPPPNFLSYGAHLLDSAFKQYIPAARRQLVSHYPLLYYGPDLVSLTYAHQLNLPRPPPVQSPVQRPPSPRAPAADHAVSSTTGPTPSPAKNKSFACGDCGKVFNAHYNLTRHMPVHTGARPNFDLKKHTRKLHMGAGNSNNESSLDTQDESTQEATTSAGEESSRAAFRPFLGSYPRILDPARMTAPNTFFSKLL